MKDALFVEKTNSAAFFFCLISPLLSVTALSGCRNEINFIVNDANNYCSVFLKRGVT